MSDEERCPHCGARMIKFTKVDREGNVTEASVCIRRGACEAERQAKLEAWRRRAA
jgi:hypothetical protein